MSGAAPLAEPACAGAWTQNAGQRQSITTFSRETGDYGQSWRAGEFNEIGLGGGWGFNLKVETETRIGAVVDSRTGVQAGLQKSFALGERGSISVVASYLNGESLDGPDCQGEGYEVRTAAGTSFVVAGREAFINAEGGWRARGETCDRTFVEVTTGLEVFPKWRTMAKVWSETGSFSNTTKIEGALLFDWADDLAVGVAWREEISRDFDEKGWVVSMWRTY